MTNLTSHGRPQHLAQDPGDDVVKRVSAQEVRALVLSSVEPQLAALGLKPEDTPDDFDLLTQGVIDSLGILELIAKVEKHLGITIDFENLTPEDLTIVGPFCRYVAEKSSAGNGQGP
jgi:acyl carrier protein